MSESGKSVKNVAILFSDIQGSAELTEQRAEAMRSALARHDDSAVEIVARNGGELVQLTGDGVYAIFEHATDAVLAAIELQDITVQAERKNGITLFIRCGINIGPVEPRGHDLFFGSDINRAARIMSAAHGGQILVSQAMASAVQAASAAPFDLRDVGTVRLRGLDHPERLYQVLHPALRSEFPAVVSQIDTPNNLPHLANDTIGRVRELDELKRLIATARLVTLTGTGGIGKSRLAIDLVRAVMEDYPGGAWLVDLAALTSDELVMQEIASTLGVREQTGRTLAAALEDYARSREAIILLDNCEHLLDASAQAATLLLRSGRGVRIVSTSREPLRIDGESVYDLQPLAVPGLTSAPTRDDALGYDSVRLFAARAAQASAGFAVTDATAAAVMDICRRLDGLPLALELAAARVRTIALPVLARRLEDRFRLLRHGDRAKLPRQRALRTLIDWSYDLLAPAEQSLLGSLSVFPGSFSLESVERVCSPAVPQADVLEHLSALVEKSLVVRNTDDGRYRLLETIREYARERLEQHGDARRVRACHRDEYVAFAERARVGMLGHDQAAWLAAVDVERDNLLAAHEQCSDDVHAIEQGFELAHALKLYWLNRGLPGVGYRLLEEALARDSPPSRLRTRALFDAGQLAYFLGEYADACAHLEQSLALASALDSSERIAAVLQPLGMAYLALGRTDLAREHLQRAVVMSRELGHTRDLAAALNSLAQLLRSQGDLAEARQLYEEVLSITRSSGDRESTAIALLNLSMTAITSGCLAAAVDALDDAAEIADHLASPSLIQATFDVATGLAVARQDALQAARWHGIAEKLMAETGLQRDPADHAFLAPLVEDVRGALGAAFGDAALRGSRLSRDAAVEELKRWLTAI